MCLLCFWFIFIVVNKYQISINVCHAIIKKNITYFDSFDTCSNSKYWTTCLILSSHWTIQWLYTRTLLFLINYLKLYTTFLIIRPVEYIDMTNADHLPQVNSPCRFCKVVSRNRTLASRGRTIRVITIHRILTSIILICIWPWMVLPCRSS